MRIKKRHSIIRFLKLESCAAAGSRIERLDKIVKPAGCLYNRNRAIFCCRSDSAARSHNGRASETCPRCLDSVRQWYCHTPPSRRSCRNKDLRQFAKKSFHISARLLPSPLWPCPRWKGVRRHLGDQIESFLVDKSRDDAYQRFAHVFRRQSKHFEQGFSCTLACRINSSPNISAAIRPFILRDSTAM